MGAEAPQRALRGVKAHRGALLLSERLVSKFADYFRRINLLHHILSNMILVVLELKKCCKNKGLQGARNIIYILTIMFSCLFFISFTHAFLRFS